MKKEQDFITNTLEDILKHVGVKPTISITSDEENVYNINIQGNDLNLLIGYRGESLNALQSLMNLIALKQLGKSYVISVDINDYKNRRLEKLLDIAKGFIDKVRFFEKDVELPPMNPWERRQVHVLVSEYPDIESESTGEGEHRRVVLKPKKSIK